MIKIISFSKFTNIQSQSASRYTPQKGNCRKTETRQTECTEKIKIINPLKRFLICGCCCWILLLHLPSSLSFCQPFGNRCPCIAHTQRCQVGFPRCVGSSPCRPICYIYIQLVCFFFLHLHILFVLSMKCPLAVIALRHYHMTLSQRTISCQLWLVLVQSADYVRSLANKPTTLASLEPHATVVDCHLRQRLRS